MFVEDRLLCIRKYVIINMYMYAVKVMESWVPLVLACDDIGGVEYDTGG